MTSRSLFTLDQDRQILDWNTERATELYSVDVATVEFKDNGELKNPDQLKDALECIRHTRKACSSGVVVALFIHGWQHDASIDISTGKGDEHFRDFRKLLLSLMHRESERPVNPVRRVIGVYIGWRGKYFRWRWLSKFNNLTFFGRFRTATRIGGKPALHSAISDIVQATKEPIETTPPAEDSPLIMMGHSMGALMLEKAYQTLLRDDPASLINQGSIGGDGVAQVTQNGQPISFPDLVLLLNSAAPASMARETTKLLEDLGLSKRVSGHGLEYTIPLIVSFTAESDNVTRLVWPIANHFQWTEGHQCSLHTHRLERSPTNYLCPPANTGYTAGQSWHCLRRPEAPLGTIESVAIDLPRIEDCQDECHVRFVLREISPDAGRQPMWLFHVPDHISKSHSDIFNNRSSLFALAMMQISGAVVSMFVRWEDVFEPEKGPCT